MKLFEPLDIGRMVIPNRIMVPAMVTHLTSEEGYVTDNTIGRYERYATGGAGLIVVEAMAIHEVKSGPLLRISDDRYIPALRRLTDRVHAVSDSKIVPQIIHFLKVARSGWRQTVDQLSVEEIERIIEQFGDAVARAREAGFDGAELHSAHAYTLSSFLSRANERSDDYSGQTLEGRLHLISRVIENVRRKAGEDFPLGVRFNGEEFIKDGYTVLESKVIALRLAKLGADYLSVSVGGKFEDAVHKPGQVLYPYTGYSGDRCMPGELFPPALHVPIADEIKAFLFAHGVGTPVAIAGKLAEPLLAEGVLAQGRADIVGLARGLLADPDWPNKVKRGDFDSIVQCDYCNVCKALDGAHKLVVCHLWPQGSLQAPPADNTERAPRWESNGQSPLQGEIEEGRVSLRWKKVPGAAYYNVFRVDDDAPPRLADAVKVTRWNDTTVAAGIRYRYYVRACSPSGLASPRTNEVVAEIRARDVRSRAPATSDYLPGFVPWPAELARRYREAGYWEGITLVEMLQRTMRRCPDKTAVVDGARRLTYTQLVSYVERLAGAFHAAGLRPRERVVFQMPNSVDMLAAFFALTHIGVIPVLVLPAHRRTEVAHFLRNAEAVAYIIPDVVRGFDYRQLANEVAQDHPLRSVIVFGEAAPGQLSISDLYAGSKPWRGTRANPGDVAFMLLSGGTTGLPKLIPRTHEDYVYNLTATGRMAGYKPETVYLAIAPMSHNYALGCPGVTGVLRVGGTVVIAPANDAETVFALVQSERITDLNGTVALVARWLALDADSRYDLSSLKYFVSGGAKLVPELRRRVEERFGCTYQESFGCGEGLINLTALDAPEHVRYESSGRPSSEADEIKIIDDEGNEVPEGQLGELAVRGPYTIRGYYNSPEINKSAFTPDGYYKMGDIVRRVDGYFYLEGRKKDLINRGGEKISSEEVENFILAHAKVQSVCVVAMPDAEYGEKACAFVIPREGACLTFEELVAFLLKRGIAKFKMPERLEVVSEFPMSPAGKILRRELREIIADRIAVERKLSS